MYSLYIPHGSRVPSFSGAAAFMQGSRKARNYHPWKTKRMQDFGYLVEIARAFDRNGYYVATVVVIGSGGSSSSRSSGSSGSSSSSSS